MSRHVRALGALMLVLSVVLGACGSSAAAPSDLPPTSAPGATQAPATGGPAETASADPAMPSPGTALDACAIVTPADVAAALGAPDAYAPGALEASPTALSPGRTTCTYTGDAGRVIVQLTPEDGANLYDAARGSYKDAVDVTGTGADGAFVSVQNKRAFVWKGSVAVMFTVFPAGGPISYDHAESFAKAVIEKL